MKESDVVLGVIKRRRSVRRFDGRGFYASLGYRIVAEFPDFYAPGDAKIVFRKNL